MVTTVAVEGRDASNPTYQAYRILHFAFTALPVIAGLDKFTHILVNWDMYLALPMITCRQINKNPRAASAMP
jgi:hypothetical protein